MYMNAINKSKLKLVCKCLHPTCHVGTISIGEQTKISKKCLIDITGDVIIGNYCLIDDYVKIYTHYHICKGKKIMLINDLIGYKHKKICDDVWLYESIILPKCEYIANGVVIGAGSVVTKSIYEEFTIWAGNPARKIKKR